jgi:hypothetical protein
MKKVFPAAVVLIALATSGCATRPDLTAVASNSPIVIEGLKVVSAGHTGCLPDDNQISIISAKADGSGLWTATCKGKTYLCSSVATAGVSSYSCAPQVN